MTRTIFFVLLFSAQVLFARSASESMPPEAVFLRSLIPADRVGGSVRNTQLTQHKLYIRVVTLRLEGEFSFNENFSLHAKLPHTKKYVTDEDTRNHTDNMNIGLKFAHGTGNWRPVYGVDVFLATGDDEAGIGSKRLGNVEIYGGTVWYNGFIALGGLFRFNTQTNNRFRETGEQRFERTWLVDATLALSLKPLDLLLELTRAFRYNPRDRKRYTTVVAPGFNYWFGNRFHFSLSLPYALSISRQFDAGVILRGTYYY